MSVIFVHIPRTGGNSIRWSLGITTPQQHLPARYLRECSDWGSSAVFSIIRNPFDRLVSLCAFMHRRKLTQQHRMLTPVEFREWLSGPLWEPGAKSAPLLYQDQGVNIDVCAPMTAYLEENGEILVKNLLKFEELPGSFERFCERHKIGAFRLPNLNGGPRAVGYRDFYDDESRAIAEELYKVDFDNFGYEF